MQIPVTGDEESSDEPFIVINWDALGDALRNFWERLQTVEIDLTPGDDREGQALPKKLLDPDVPRDRNRVAVDRTKGITLWSWY